MRNPRLVACALALGVALTILWSPAALATAAPEPSVTIAPGATASFNIAGFSLSSSQPAPASVQVAANPTSFANGATWRNIVYYAVSWGLINSDPASVQAALWYVSSGAWPAGDHSTAQRLVDTARSSATPASTANGYDLLSAISGGRASAVASFSSSSGSVTVTNLQFTNLTVFLPYGTILVGPDGQPADVVYATGSSGNPSAPPSATPAIAPPTATAVAGLPTAQPTAVGGGQPSATPTNATGGQPTATTTVTVTATLPPKPTATVNGANSATSAGSSPTQAAPLNPTSTASPPTAMATATAIATATALPSSTPTLAPTVTAKPASATAVPLAKPAIDSVSGQSQIAQIVPTPISTVDDSLASPIPTGGTGLPTDVATIIFPTFTPHSGGGQPTAIPSATSIFPPTATAAFATPVIAPTLGPPPVFGKPTPVKALASPTLPTLPNEAPPGATVIPPGGSGTASGGSVTGTGKPPGIAPTTGEQSSWPLYLLIIGLAALVVGVVVIRMGNRAAKK